MPRSLRFGFRGVPRQAQRLGMTNFTDLPPVPSDPLVLFSDQLRVAMMPSTPGVFAP